MSRSLNAHACPAPMFPWRPGRLNCARRAGTTEHKLGFVFAAESGFRLSNDSDTVLGVDITFVTIAMIQKDEGFFQGAPDLAIEVISSGNTGPEIHAKIV